MFLSTFVAITLRHILSLRCSTSAFRGSQQFNGCFCEHVTVNVDYSYQYKINTLSP
nr:MAG TPA: hypothetical protein [Caudoviricetes sp.]